MAEQLDLFTGLPVPAFEGSTASDVEPAYFVSDAAQVLSGQTDLFGDRWLRASAAHEALRSFDLEGAAEALDRAVRRYPGDLPLRERREVVARLADRLRREIGKKRSMAEALAAMAGTVPAFLEIQWHRRLAESMEAESGPGATFDGISAGLHWLRAGEAVRAEQSLRSTLARDPSDCRTFGYLADALVAQQRLSEARIAYRDALAASPRDVDFVNLADAAVRDLPRLAEYEYEVSDPPVEWAAAVGLIEGLFIPPPVVRHQDSPAPTVIARLAPGLQFYRWLVAERAAGDDEERIACRRAMKALSPRLLQRLLQPGR
jgi:tetratricopeptide (TPR) repeat protein